MHMKTRRSFLVTFVASALSLLPVASAVAQEIAVKHAQGEITLPAVPNKVLVFDLASLDTLTALGVEVAGVPTLSYPPSLAKYGEASYPKIGSLFEPDFEAVNAADAELIIVGGRSAAKYADLAKIGTTIDLTVDADNYVSSTRSNIETLGRIFGKEAEATALLAELDTSIAAVQAAAADAGKGLLILTTGGKMSAYGPGSRFGLIHSEFGVEPAIATIETANHGQAISFEFILETNPDWLFVIDRDSAIGRDGVSANQFLDNELVGQTTAWKNGQVVYLNPANWYLVGGGATALKENADQIAKALSKQ